MHYTHSSERVRDVNRRAEKLREISIALLLNKVNLAELQHPSHHTVVNIDIKQLTEERITPGSEVRGVTSLGVVLTYRRKCHACSYARDPTMSLRIYIVILILIWRNYEVCIVSARAHRGQC